MPNNESAPKRPLIEELDDVIKSTLQGARFEDRTVNQEQYMVLRNVCETLSDLIEGEAHITLHPAVHAGYITVKASNVYLEADKVSALRSALAQCTALSIEPLDNGSIEVGVTVPNVFYPVNS